jgi:hypothetical protein
MRCRRTCSRQPHAALFLKDSGSDPGKAGEGGDGGRTQHLLYRLRRLLCVPVREASMQAIRRYHAGLAGLLHVAATAIRD